MIDSIAPALGGGYGSTKIVVFTAYLHEKFYSKEYVGGKNPVTESWFPTMFFYNLHEDKVEWEIFGAEQFVAIDSFKKVTVLTNEIWNEINRDEYQALKDADPDNFTRHWEYDNFVWQLSYNSSPPQEELIGRFLKAPEVPTLHAYKLTFGINKKLEITQKVKLVEAHLHN